MREGGGVGRRFRWYGRAEAGISRRAAHRSHFTAPLSTPPPRFLTDSGIEYLREFLNLPSEIVPATLKKSTRPLERDSRPPRRDGPPRRFGGDREGYRGAEGKTGAPGEYRPEVSTPPAGSLNQDGRAGPGLPRVAAGGHRSPAALMAQSHMH